MPRKTLTSLGPMVRKKRASRKLREVAREIGIGPATLMRIEAGRVPDVETFGKVCKWLDEDPGSFLGFEQARDEHRLTGPKAKDTVMVSAHLKADSTPQPATIQALAKMIWFVTERQRATLKAPQDADV
jgi:transcriptional regulator with XRE-family HTH domain